MTSGVFLNCFPAYIFRTAYLTEPEVHGFWLNKLAGKPRQASAMSMCPVLHLQVCVAMNRFFFKVSAGY